MDSSKIMPKVFLWMFIGLAVTFLTGSYIANDPSLILDLFTPLFPGFVLVEFIAELAIVIFLTARIHKMKPTTAKIMFLLYSLITGLTFASVFIVYDITSIMYVFLATALIMLVFGVIGYTTKMDLTKLSSFLFMAIIGILIMSLINIFVGSEEFSLGICIISVIVFVIYIAFDVQKVKQLYEQNALPEENLAIYGALQLYLDFINIFLDLLRIFGNRD